MQVNDNFPVFYPREYKVNVQADALEANRGERVPLVVVAATDLDSASQPNGQIQYHLLQTSGNDAAASKGLFEVDARTGQIFLVRPLSSSSSQQQQQQFRLNVLARDGGGLESKESALVQISVLPPATEADSRTAMPVFVQRQFSFSVSENVAQGAIVGTVRAKIEGAGADHHNSNSNSNSGISYAIYSGDPDGYFSIDPRAGTISAKSGNIDRERYSHLLLNVQAYTGQYPGPYRYAHTQVNVTIVDENDNVSSLLLVLLFILNHFSTFFSIKYFSSSGAHLSKWLYEDQHSRESASGQLVTDYGGLRCRLRRGQVWRGALFAVPRR